MTNTRSNVGAGVVLLIAAAAVCASAYASARAAHERDAIATALTGGDPSQGRLEIIAHGCASCHTIPGIPGANALVGPPLTQMIGRSYVAGVVPNTPENLIAWLMNPPAVDPKTAMPNLNLRDGEARDIAAYLYAVR